MCVTHGQMFFRNAAEVVEGCQGSRPSSKQSILYLLQGFCCRLLVFRIFNLSNQTLKKACQQSGSFGVLSLQIWSEVGQDPPLFCASLKALSKVRVTTSITKLLPHVWSQSATYTQRIRPWSSVAYTSHAGRDKDSHALGALPEVHRGRWYFPLSTPSHIITSTSLLLLLRERASQYTDRSAHCPLRCRRYRSAELIWLASVLASLISFFSLWQIWHSEWVDAGRNFNTFRQPDCRAGVTWLQTVSIRFLEAIGAQFSVSTKNEQFETNIQIFGPYEPSGLARMSAQMLQVGSGTTGKPGRAGTNQCTCPVANTVALSPLDLFGLMKVGLLPELFAVGHPLVRHTQTQTPNDANVHNKNCWPVFVFWICICSQN